MNSIERFKYDKVLLVFQKAIENYSTEMPLLKQNISILEDGVTKPEVDSLTIITDQLMQRIKDINQKYDISFPIL